MLAMAPCLAHATTYQYVRAIPQLNVTDSGTTSSSGTTSGGGSGSTSNSSGTSSGGSGTNSPSSGNTNPTPSAPAVVTASATSIDFGDTLLGLSATRAIVLSNPGATVVDWTKLPYLTGNVGFSAETTCNASLAQNDSCLVNITYLPTIAAGGSGALQVETNAPPLTIGLTGTGKSWLGALQTSATSLDFGALQLGQSANRALTVTNTGAVPAALSLGALSAPFSVSNTTCGALLSGGASCAFTLQYTPSAGDPTGFTVPLNWGAGHEQKNLTLGGATYQASLSKTAYDFGNTPVGTPSAPYAVVVSNNGSASLTVGTPTLSAPYSFNAQGSTCFAGPLAPQASCQIPLTFSPTAIGTAPTGDLAVPTNAGTLHLALNGTGSSALSALSISSTSYNFGSIGVGNSATTTITLTNTSGSAQALSVGAVAAPFTLSGQSTCGTSLAANASCNLVLTFTPPSFQSYDVSNAVPLTWGALSEHTGIRLYGSGADANLNMVTLSVNGNGSATDSSQMANTLVNSTATVSSTVHKYGTGSLYFNGTNSHYTVAANSAFSFAQTQQDFTVETWINPTDVAGSPKVMASVWPQNGNDQWILALTGNTVTFYWSPYNSSYGFLGGGTIVAGQWSHVAVTRSGNTFRLFVNGTQVASNTNTGVNGGVPTPLDIGHYGSSQNSASIGSWFYGYMDDIRITTGVARYTGNFTPPGGL